MHFWTYITVDDTRCPDGDMIDFVQPDRTLAAIMNDAQCSRSLVPPDNTKSYHSTSRLFTCLEGPDCARCLQKVWRHSTGSGQAFFIAFKMLSERHCIGHIGFRALTSDQIMYFVVTCCWLLHENWKEAPYNPPQSRFHFWCRAQIIAYLPLPPLTLFAKSRWSSDLQNQVL